MFKALRNILMPLFLLFAMTSLTACDKVPVGHVGVKAYLLGGDKGVDHEVLTPGKYWIGINEELYLFPTFVQNVVWDLGTEANREIIFQTKEGLTVKADFGLQYQLDEKKIPILFQKYRKGINEITDTNVRNTVRDVIVKQASIMDIESLYGAGKAEFLRKVEEETKTRLAESGILVQSVYVVGEFRLPQQIVEAINAKTRATQMTQQRENEVAQSKAEADKKIEEARGDAESILVVARAQAEANKLVSSSLTPQLVQYTEVQKWNGVRSLVEGGSGTIVSLPKQ